MEDSSFSDIGSGDVGRLRGLSSSVVGRAETRIGSSLEPEGILFSFSSRLCSRLLSPSEASIEAGSRTSKAFLACCATSESIHESSSVASTTTSLSSMAGSGVQRVLEPREVGITSSSLLIMKR
jgi:hypothetical protein